MTETPALILSVQRRLRPRKDEKGARRMAAGLMRRTLPKRLCFDPYGKIHIEESKRMSLMGLVLRNKFDHLYIMHDQPASEEVLVASRATYNRAQAYLKLLEDYPDPLTEVGYTMSRELGSFALISRKTGETLPVMINSIPFAPTNSEIITILARRDAVIRFMYEWCLDVAGERMPNFRAEYKAEGATLSYDEVSSCMTQYQLFLSYFAEHSHPVTFHVIDRLLINPKTGLPFNIHIPKF